MSTTTTAARAAKFQAEAAFAEQLHDAAMGALLVQDTTDFGVQIVAVKIDPDGATPWLMASGASRRNAGALAHLSSAMPNLRIVLVDVEPVSVYVATLYGGSKSYACAEHRTGNHKPATGEDRALDAAAVCWFDTAHGASVTDAEADAMLLGVR